ncbi:hypothetical protein LguiB_007732 [Lonicera macranthoides]
MRMTWRREGEKGGDVARGDWLGISRGSLTWYPRCISRDKRMCIFVPVSFSHVSGIYGIALVCPISAASRKRRHWAILHSDPLLFPFLCNLPFLDPKTTNKQHEPISSNSSNAPRPEVLDEAQEEDYKERRQRAAFLQQLILSTIF